MQQPRCVKCGRKLKAPESIARGMGPKCAGVSSKGRGVKIRMRKHYGSAYSLGISGGLQQPMPIGDLPDEKISKRELIPISDVVQP